MSGLSSVCRRRGHDDPCVDGGSAMYGIRIVCRALQESTRPNRHPRYGKPAPENGTYLLQCGVRRTWAVEFAARGEFTAPTSRDPLAKSPSAPSGRLSLASPPLTPTGRTRTLDAFCDRAERKNDGKLAAPRRAGGIASGASIHRCGRRSAVLDAPCGSAIFLGYGRSSIRPSPLRTRCSRHPPRPTLPQFAVQVF